MTETFISILAGLAAGTMTAFLLFRWLFDGMSELLGVLGRWPSKDPGWASFYACHGQRRIGMLKLGFGVAAPALLMGVAASTQLAHLLA